MWKLCSEITGKLLGTDFESVAKFWLQEKSKSWLNILTTAVFWSIWKFRNNMCFQDRKWIRMQELMRSWLQMVKDWVLLQDTEGRMVLGGENGARTGKAASTTVGVTALQAPRDAEQRDL
jgi:hypothetical protein